MFSFLHLNQRGFSPLLLIAGATLLIFILITSTAPFRNKVFSSLFPKQFSYAAGTVNWSTGYYPGWQQPGYPPSSIPWNSLTHVIHFSVLTSSARNGSINTTAHSMTPQRMQAAVAEAHNHNKKILLAIGGAEDNNWDAACNSTNRTTFITNLVNLMQQYGYDGIDLDIEQDWQSPAHTDYIACVAGIRNALNQITPRPLLTHPGDPDWQAYMLVQVWQYLDQINLMDYWRDANHISTGLNNYTNLGIPKSLLGVGIGTDDGGFDGTNPADCGAKAQFAVDNGYAGVMTWTIPADSILHNGQTPCFNAIAPFVSTSTSTPSPSPSVAASPLNPPSPSPSPSKTPSPSPSATPVPSAKPGDTDGDNDVDIFDYNTLLTNFGKTGTNLQGDFDGNNKVDIFDYNILLTNFGK